MQGDGNLLVYNSQKYAQYGASAQAAVFSSNSYGVSTKSPFALSVGPSVSSSLAYTPWAMVAHSLGLLQVVLLR